MEGLSSPESIKNELISIEKQHEYQSQLGYRFKVMKREEEEKQELMQALQTKDLGWWKEKIAGFDLHCSIFDFKSGRINPEDTMKNRRLMAFLSLFCYGNANAAIAQQDENAAIKIIAIYEMADPVNPEPNFLRAMLFARRSEYNPALSQLNIAVTKGFADKDRLIRQSEFDPMHSAPTWYDLLKTLK